MTSAKSARSRGGRRDEQQEIQPDDLSGLDPDSPFTKKVKLLRAYVADLEKPLEEWTQTDSDEFRRRAEGDSLAVALALAASGGPDGVTSESPHRIFSHDAD